MAGLLDGLFNSSGGPMQISPDGQGDGMFGLNFGNNNPLYDLGGKGQGLLGLGAPNQNMMSMGLNAAGVGGFMPQMWQQRPQQPGLLHQMFAPRSQGVEPGSFNPHRIY